MQTILKPIQHCQRLTTPLLLLLCGLATATLRADVWTHTSSCSSNDFWAAAQSPIALGYRAISLSSANDQLSAVWLRDYAPSQLQWFVPHAALRSNVTACAVDGLRPVALAIWGQIPNESYLASYVRDAVPCSVFTRLNPTELAGLVAANPGSRVAWLTACLESGEARYAGVLAQDGRPGKLEVGLSPATLESMIQSYGGTGFRPVSVLGVPGATGTVYTASWIQEAQPLRWTNRIHVAEGELASLMESMAELKLRPEFISHDPGSEFQNLIAVEDLPPVWTVIGSPEPGMEGLDRVMTNAMSSTDCTRAALAVSVNGRLLVSRTYTCQPPNVLPTQATNLFRLSGVSIAITAAAVMGLVEAGKLHLDDKLGQFLDLSDVLDQRWNDITIRHLLQHRGGWDISALGFDPVFYYETNISVVLNVPLPVTQDQIITYMKTKHYLSFDPGSSRSYSNFGYLVLGRVIERVTGQNYEAFVRANVLAPLGIHSARVGRALRAQQLPGEVEYEEHSALAPSLMSPDRPLVATPYGKFNHDNLDSIAGWVFSAQDLLRFGSIFVQKTNCALLLPETLETMWMPAPQEVLPPVGWYNYYGCGWRVQGINEGPPVHVYLTGAMPGTTAMMLCKFNGLCWAVVFNTWNHGGTSPVSALGGGNALDSEIAAVTEWPSDDLFDVDTDGLPDSYELAQFGSLTASDGSRDADGDGLSDAAEWVAMSDPNNPADGPRLKVKTNTNGLPCLEVSSRGGRAYCIEAKSNLAQAWDAGTPFSRFNGDGFARELLLDPARPMEFYRFGVSLRAKPAGTISSAAPE